MIDFRFFGIGYPPRLLKASRLKREKEKRKLPAFSRRPAILALRLLKASRSSVFPENRSGNISDSEKRNKERMSSTFRKDRKEREKKRRREERSTRSDSTAPSLLFLSSKESQE